MSDFIAALPMYDWPETRARSEEIWAAIRDALRGQGIDAPQRLARHNADLPAVPGGILDAEGHAIAPDPASLPPDGLDLHTLWRHPKLLFGQTCWGPMEQGLADHVRVVGQPDYSDVEGGRGTLYSSAILMRRTSAVEARADGQAIIPLHLLRGARLAYNGPDSMSGIIGLTRDLGATGATLALFSELMETGGHRASIIAVAEGRADVCAVDCRSWDMARRFEPAARTLRPVGWTALRKGLPYVSAKGISGPALAALRNGLAQAKPDSRT